MLMDVPTVRAIGLDQGQGLYYSNTFYWDRTDGTRAFTKRLTALNNGTYPPQNVAGAYSAVLHYLKAVAALGVAKAKADGRAVVARMKAMPYDDPVFGQGTVRADGRMMNPTRAAGVTCSTTCRPIRRRSLRGLSCARGASHPAAPGVPLHPKARLMAQHGRDRSPARPVLRPPHRQPPNPLR
jgi:branched-chain amino acid transport system substrate-binding protein